VYYSKVFLFEKSKGGKRVCISAWGIRVKRDEKYFDGDEGLRKF
jgi:hypothetical protein